MAVTPTLTLTHTRAFFPGAFPDREDSDEDMDDDSVRLKRHRSDSDMPAQTTSHCHHVTISSTRIGKPQRASVSEKGAFKRQRASLENLRMVLAAFRGSSPREKIHHGKPPHKDPSIDLESMESPSLTRASSSSSSLQAMGRYMRQLPWSYVKPQASAMAFRSGKQQADDGLPPLSHGATAASQPTEQSVFTHTLWSQTYDQRHQVTLHRKAMAQLRAKMKNLRHQRLQADNKFYRTIISYSVSARVLPPDLFASLVDGVQSRQSDYNSAEAEYETLEAELDQLEARLQLSEMRLLEMVLGDQRMIGQEASLLIKNSAVTPSAIPPGRMDNNPPAGANSQMKTADLEIDDADDTDAATHRLTAPQFTTPQDPLLLGISGDRPDDVHPLYRELLSAIGDQNMAEEKLSELIIYHEGTSSELKNKILLERSRTDGTIISEEDLMDLKSALAGKIGDTRYQALASSYMDEDDIEFLQQFNGLLAKASKEIQAQRQRVRTLYSACVQAGAIPKNVSYKAEHALFDMDDDSQAENIEAFIMGDIPPPGTMDAELLTNPEFPILLSSPKHVLEPEPVTTKTALKNALDLPEDDPGRARRVDECVKEYGILTMLMRTLPENKSDFINRWLLQILRTSPLAADLLFAHFTMELRVVNPSRWQQDVLYFWTLDGGNISASAFLGVVTSNGHQQEFASNYRTDLPI